MKAKYELRLELLRVASVPNHPVTGDLPIITPVKGHKKALFTTDTEEDGKQLFSEVVSSTDLGGYLQGSEEAWRQANEEIGEVLGKIQKLRRDVAGMTEQEEVLNQVLYEFEKKWPGFFKEG